ncbi:MAG: chemotaxis protein CheD [Paracoccaceae bacterium]
MNAAICPDQPVYVTQGDYKVSDRPDVMLVTVLGSCIATCLRDPVAGIGGMNHFLLPGDATQRGTHTRYGINAMELLINGILKAGGQIGRLEAKVFGGANTSGSSLRIGHANAEFAFWFLENEGIACIGKDVGGAHARKLRFWPVSGRAQQKRLDAAPPSAPAEQVSLGGVIPPDSGELDLL